MMKNKKRREKRTEEVKEEEDLEWMKMKAAVRAGQNISTISRREVAGIVPTQESSTGPTVVLQQPLSPQAGITHYNIPHIASGHLPTSLVGTESVLPSTSSVVPAGGMRANGGPPQSVRFANIEEESSTEDGGYDPYEEEIRHWSSPHLHPPPQSTFNDLPKSPPPPSPPSISNTAHNLDPYIRPKPPPTKSSASAAAIATKGMPRPEDLNSPTATWGMLPPQRVEQENSMWENQSKVPAWQPPWASPVSATMGGFDQHQNQHPSPISQGPQAWESWGLPTKRPSVLPPVHGLAPLSGPAVAPRHPTLDDQLGNPALTTGWGGATGYSAGKNWVGEPQDGGLGSATNPRGWSAAPKEGRSNDWGTSDNHAWRGPKESKSNAWGASNAHDWGSMGGGRREWGSARPASKHKPTQSWDPGMWQTGPVEHSDSETTSEDDSYTDEYDDDRHSGTINSRWGDHGLTAPPLNATRNVLTPQENVQILNSIIRDPRYPGATNAHIQPHLEAHRNRDPNLPDEWLQSPHHDLHPAKSSINHSKKNRRHSGPERSQVSQTQQFALWGTPEKPESESDSRRVRFSPENTWGWDESQSTVSEEAPHNVTTAPRFDHIQLQQHPPLTPGVFSDSNGAALRPCKHALFAGKRHAKDRIYWFFAPDKEPRVVDFLQWVKASSDSLAEYGLRRFLEYKERGSIFCNIDFRMDGKPTVDWLPYPTIQKSLDAILQESAAQYNPAKQVVLFAFLPSKSGASIAIWRKVLNVPDKVKKALQSHIKTTVAKLGPIHNYACVTEFPPEHKAHAAAKEAASAFLSGVPSAGITSPVPTSRMNISFTKLPPHPPLAAMTKGRSSLSQPPNAPKYTPLSLDKGKDMKKSKEKKLQKIAKDGNPVKKKWWKILG